MPSCTTGFRENRLILGAAIEGNMAGVYYQICAQNAPRTSSAPSRPSTARPSTARPSTAPPSTRSTPTPRPQSASAPQRAQVAGPDARLQGMVVSRQRVNQECELFVISPPLDFDSSAFCRPGMFCKLWGFNETKPVYLAMANGPEKFRKEGTLQFLVKYSEATRWMWSLNPGEEVEMSQAQGKGFDTSKLESQVDTIILLATGTGIAPIKAMLEEHVYRWRSLGKAVRLYYGYRGCAIPYKHLFDEWQ
mmetsp:Transcript_22519/g.35228  ORF Transcript_22519/g.35228 Transcript_22519/m.35228 type:complete len:249 (-) Transcript_22519:650-1396(-)